MANRLFKRICGNSRGDYDNLIDETMDVVNEEIDPDTSNCCNEGSIHINVTSSSNVEKELKNDEQDEIIPCVGLKFDSLDEAEMFYRAYGRRHGFEIIIRNTHRHVKNNEVSSRIYICRRGGKNNLCNYFDKECEKGKRIRDTFARTECEARMCVVHRLKLKKWEVTLVELQHNHEMVSPTKIQFMQRSKNISPVVRSLIETLNKSGIGPSKVLNVLSEMGGGLENVGFTNQDIRNVLRDIRHQVFDSSDAQAGLTLLSELHSNSCGDFFYRVEVDEQNRVNNLLWVDPRCLHAYKNFGDVVTFDSTYRTNRYSMPFIPITGVNHHYHSILFGFALMRDEKESSYIWVLKTWLEAVEYKYPITIITDQDIALGKAIAEVLPYTNHIYCSWHISNKFPEKLSALYIKYPEFKNDFNTCIYKSLTVDDFETRWEILVEKYELMDHVWLQEMYAIRHKWIGAFTKLYFSAGMSTTSRSESMNLFFDEYVNPTTGLKEFIENSQKALEKQYLREKEADYETQNKGRTLLMNSSIEYHAASIYTKYMFRRFQHELQQSGPYVVKKLSEECNEYEKIYVAYKSIISDEFRKYYRLVVCNDDKICCVCKKFENSGMICRHILRYMNKMQFTEIPEHFIRMRWSVVGNKVVGAYQYNPPIFADYVNTQSGRYSALCKAFQDLGVAGSCSIPRFNHVMGVIKDQIEFVENFSKEDDIPNQIDQIDQNVILDPIISQTKGRKKVERIKSGIEVSKSTRDDRQCGFCKMKGAKHDKRNCPLRSSIQYG